MPLDATDLAAIRQLLDEKLATLRFGPGERSLATAEARQYVNRLSNASFGRWCEDYSVRHSAKARYMRSALDRGLEREKNGHISLAGLKRRRERKKALSKPKLLPAA